MSTAPRITSIPSDIAVLKAGQGDQDDAPDSKPEASHSKTEASDSKPHDANGDSTSDSDYVKHWFTVSLGLYFIAVAITSEVLSKLHGFNITLDDTELSSAVQTFKSFGPAFIFESLFYLFGLSHDAVKPLDVLPISVATPPIYAADIRHISESWNFLTKARLGSLHCLKKYQSFVDILGLISHLEQPLSPLASAYFEILTKSHPVNVNVTVSGRVNSVIATLPDRVRYARFASAAGSLDAFLRDGVIPSPYLLNDTAGWWTVPRFAIANQTAPVQGGNVSTEVSAAMVQAKCAPAFIANITGPVSGLYNITGTLPNGCSVTSYAIPNGEWFGWAIPAPFECVQGINPKETNPAQADPNRFYNPVAFSFLRNISMYSMVFCYSSLVGHNVTARYGFNAPNSGIYSVVNKTAPTSLGYGPNGLTFSNDTRIAGVGDAVKYTLADAIAKYAGYTGVRGSDVDTSLQDTVLSDSIQVSNKAQPAFALYQALAVQSTFIYGPAFTQNATHDEPQTLLKANKRISHVLTAVCLIVGFAIIILFWPYDPSRKASQADP